MQPNSPETWNLAPRGSVSPWGMIPMRPQTNYSEFPIISDEIKWKMKIQGRKKNVILSCFWWGYWKDRSILLLPGTLPRHTPFLCPHLWASGHSPIVKMTSFIPTCAFLAAKMSSGNWDHLVRETRISLLICATLETSISELLSFPGTQSPSLHVMNVI